MKRDFLPALQQRDRIRLVLSVRDLQKLVMAVDDVCWPPVKNISDLMVPETLQVPHLRHLSQRAASPVQ